MTPKDKAKELFESYKEIIADEFIAIKAAKKCVNKIIDALENFATNDTKEDPELLKFYEEVYKEFYSL